MRVLVAYASKHGSTREIAARIAASLEQHGLTVDLRPTNHVDGLDGYDAVVIGSAVYIGRWMKEATEFVERLRPALAGSRVWLFSSGPLGDQPGVDPPQVAELEASLNVVEHRLFAGSMSKDRLSLVERALVKGVKAPYGDFRDWNAIDWWATGIAKQLSGSPTAQAAAGGVRGE
jgi:menaquinone-dependent protoporphyrinogen oxidase